MESKNKKIISILYSPIFVSIVFCLLFQACWTNEAGFNEKDTLFDNFKVVEDPHNLDAGLLLVENFDEGLYETIAEHCQEIYFDSTNIYVKSISNPPVDSSFKYHYIKVKSQAIGDKKSVFENRELTFSDYNRGVWKCKRCVKKSYP